MNTLQIFCPPSSVPLAILRTPFSFYDAHANHCEKQLNKNWKVVSMISRKVARPCRALFLNRFFVCVPFFVVRPGMLLCGRFWRSWSWADKRGRVSDAGHGLPLSEQGRLCRRCGCFSEFEFCETRDTCP